MKHILSASRRPWASALFAALLLGLVALSGCAGQQATVTPTVVVEKEALGRGVEVATTVRDVRSEPVVGLCNPGSSFAGKLTMACDPAPAIRSAVEKGLREKGFTPAPASESVVRSLSVELTDLAYKPQQEGAQLVARAVAVLAVKVDNNGQALDRRYEAETVWKLSGDNVEPEFDKLLSQTVSKAISRLVSDYELIHFLEKTVLRARDIK
jgi:uncharacterized lipoprotein